MKILFNPYEIIRRKRDGETLSLEEIRFFIKAVTEASIPDYQISAFLMATFFQGMNSIETAELTKAMIQSGKQVDFGLSPSRPKIDKHSTGGIGDKVSLILGPIVAALDVDVPMVAGRSLGHTGGTLDKLESIPGFQVNLSIEEFKKNVLHHGLSIMGQTEDFVPADKRLYALRDVTATVDCMPLIIASILSKKAAEGISGLVLDIKVGNGALMTSQKQAEKLAKAFVSVGKELGLRIRILLTDMNQPLGFAVGHTLEVLECLQTLKGKGPSDLKKVTIELAAHMLILAEKCTALSAARNMARKALQEGSALKKFRQMCLAQHAHVDIVEHPETLPLSSHKLEVHVRKPGYLSRIDGRQLGLLLIDLGGGRRKTSDRIDHGVGFYFHAKLGHSLKEGSSLATVYYNPERMDKDEILDRMHEIYAISSQKPQALELIKKVVE